jgi:hypothetical protein
MDGHTAVNATTDQIEQDIRLALKGIRFGSVEVIVHDSRVVQIERKEKLRYDAPSVNRNR